MRPAVRHAALALGVALVVRVAAAAFLGIDGPPDGDERGYALLAESLAAGRGLHLPVPDDVLASAGVPDLPALRSFRAPLLPVLLAPIAYLGGGLVAMRGACLLLGALTSALLVAAARPLVGARAALLAGLLHALWPPAIHVSLRAFSEPLCLALLVSAAGVVRTRPGWAGALGGLAALARPAALLPALGVALAAGPRRRVAVAAGATLLCVLPWVVRTSWLHGRPLLSTNSGVTLVGANSAAAADAEPPGKWLPPAEVYAGRGDAPDLGMWGWSALDEAGSDARFREHAVAWAREHPRAALALVGSKLVRLVDPDPHSRRADAGRKRVIGWLTLPPVLVLALIGTLIGAGGAARRARQRGAAQTRGSWLPWWGLVVGTCATTVVFYGDTRMRAPADPALLLAAAAGLSALLPGATGEDCSG